MQALLKEGHLKHLSAEQAAAGFPLVCCPHHRVLKGLDNFRHLTDRLIIGHSLSYLAFSCMGTLETQKEVMRMRKEDLFPQLCMWHCGGMAVPHISAACGAFYPCMKSRQESENEILLRVTQPPMDISEDYQELHGTHVGTSAHL